MEDRASFWRRHRWLSWFAGGVLVLLVALAVAVSIVLRRTEPFLRAHIVETLQDRFHARVELDSFHVSLAHGLQAEGRGLRIWPPAQVQGITVSPATDTSDPLIRLDEFRFLTPLRFEPGKPFHVGVVELNGLDIHVPPKSHFGRMAGDAKTPGAPPAAASLITFALDGIECTSAHFVLESSKPGKLPLDFAIARFTLSNVTGGPIRAGSVMHFETDLTNPRPVGSIHSTGNFGPWRDEDPGESPIQGDYQFDHADLASFKGIAGILSSTGKYQGTLRDLIVDGETDTPDFRLAHFGNAMPLHTHFHAKVDATNGDTWLEPVDALLGHSHFTAQGQVVRVMVPDPATGQPTSKGHDIALNINIAQGRIEDFLHLASNNSTPLLTGSLTMKAALHIPPGHEPVHKRLNLKGVFNLDQVRFASEKIQGRITDLSLRGQGLPHEIKRADPSTVRSTMQGDFQMAAAVITLPSLTYTVPGATIQLKGAYGTEGGALDFNGVAKLNATVSQMVGGVLGVLLKPADRIFKKDGAGTEVPIRISGTREDPQFEVEIKGLRHKPKSASAGNTPSKK
ncbi:MAG: hypothetical protein ABR987_05390 [Terracidiphilus sp.]